MIDSDWLPKMDSFLWALKRQEPIDPVWGFHYMQFVVIFRKVQHKVVPYQLRHSRPAPTWRGGARTLAEVVERGQCLW